MGGPMNYARFVNRNGLQSWGYRGNELDSEVHTSFGWEGQSAEQRGDYLSGELRRMEEDTFEPERIVAYAKAAGISGPKAALLLRTFLGIPEPGCPECAKYHSYEHGKLVILGRCGKHAVW